MIKYQLILLLFTLPLLGFQVPKNHMPDLPLSWLTGEQKVSTYSLAKSIKDSSYTSKIKLVFNDGSSSNLKIDHLLKTFKSVTQNAGKSDKMTDHLKLHTSLKIKEIKEIKLFILDKSGEKIIKFESPGLKIGKRKIGPFEVPSNKNLIISPKITYY